MDFYEKTPFPKDPFFLTRPRNLSWIFSSNVFGDVTLQNGGDVLVNVQWRPFSRKQSMKNPQLGRTPKGSYSPRGRSRHLLETPFSEPLLRTLLRTLFYCKNHIRHPSQNPSENPFPRTLPRTFSEPFLERCVAVRPLRRAPNGR